MTAFSTSSDGYIKYFGIQDIDFNWFVYTNRAVDALNNVLVNREITEDTPKTDPAEWVYIQKAIYHQVHHFATYGLGGTGAQKLSIGKFSIESTGASAGGNTIMGVSRVSYKLLQRIGWTYRGL